MAALVIRDIETDEEVRRLDVTGKSERQIEKIERGMLRQMDTERYYVGEEA